MIEREGGLLGREEGGGGVGWTSDVGMCWGGGCIGGSLVYAYA